MITAHHALTAAGTTTRGATGLTGIARSVAARDKKVTDRAALRAHLRPAAPANRLTDAERGRVLEALNSARFIDTTPAQMFAVLLDEGEYLCSVSTMYRVLREHSAVRERRRLARHPAKACPELVATGPRQVYTWDITKLPGPVKGVYFDAYVMIDIYSRYIVGAHVQTRESGLLAEELMCEIFAVHGIPHVLHADRGTAMTSKPVAELLEDLQVTRSHSRPRVSNDNPYSEAWFKTLKYAPTFPERFGSIHDARGFLDEFVDWYNHEHRHSGIGMHTPADVHFGLAEGIAAQRAATLDAARQAHPERFGTTTVPTALELPEAAWINRPQTASEQAPVEQQNAAA